ncbi:hypothetical protein ACSMFR_10860 [Listeria aquatica]|uniref:hypothetical protein n=1 Tax=Listeria aquatica TaxID=1494960 RepID=UPI003F722487
MKKVCITIFLMVIISLLSACDDGQKHSLDSKDDPRKIIYYSAKYTELAETVQNLDKSSPIVIVGTKGVEKQIVERETKDSDTPTNFYTLGNIKVKKIDKDKTKKISAGQTIRVLEDSVTNVAVNGEKVDLTVDGYKKMEKGKDYILFIRKSTSGDNYVLTNAILSKYPKQHVEVRSLFLKDANTASSELEDRYNQFYSEIRNKY